MNRAQRRAQRRTRKKGGCEPLIAINVGEAYDPEIAGLFFKIAPDQSILSIQRDDWFDHATKVAGEPARALRVEVELFHEPWDFDNTHRVLTDACGKRWTPDDFMPAIDDTLAKLNRGARRSTTIH